MSKIHNSLSKDNLPRKEGYTPKSGKRSRRGKDTRSKGKVYSIREQMILKGNLEPKEWKERYALQHGGCVF
jgi:hypothetical protein